jgi:hypothetical protein
MLLGSINTIIGVIQQGCEMYTEYKDTVAETVEQAKQTYGQVMEIKEEVTGFWGFLMSKLFGKKEPEHLPDIVEKVAPTVVADGPPDPPPQQLDEFAVYSNIAKNLIKYYRVLEQIQEKLRIEEEKSKDLDNDTAVNDGGIMRVIIEDQLIKASARLREVMCWNTPRELGALYEKVTAMRLKIMDEREAVREQKRKLEQAKRWRLEQLQSRIKLELGMALVAFLGVLQVWGMWITLVTHRPLQ